MTTIQFLIIQFEVLFAIFLKVYQLFGRANKSKNI